MQSLTQFINAWNGRRADYDRIYGCQCTDIAKYWEANLGLKILTGNPKDYNLKAYPDYTYIPNSLTGLFRPGDLVIWNGYPASTVYGHVAVGISSNLLNFRSFDQNWPPGSSCHIQNHSWRGVKGWLRPKKAFIV